MDFDAIDRANKAQGSPLDRLDKQLNLVLEHTGRVFRSAAKDPKHVHAAKFKQVVPVAYESFQDALDALEVELSLARSILRRELDAIRVGEREQAAAIEPPMINGDGEGHEKRDVQTMDDVEEIKDHPQTADQAIVVDDEKRDGDAGANNDDDALHSAATTSGNFDFDAMFLDTDDGAGLGDGVGDAAGEGQAVGDSNVDGEGKVDKEGAAAEVVEGSTKSGDENNAIPVPSDEAGAAALDVDVPDPAQETGGVPLDDMMDYSAFDLGDLGDGHVDAGEHATSFDASFFDI